MFLNLILLAVGFVLLTKGADFFVDGASALAEKFKIPSIIIGLTIVAMGTSAPEASVSLISAIKGSGGVAIGNVIGSNIANVFLILGFASLISPLVIQKNTIKYEIPFVGFITVLLGFFGWYFGQINRLAAFIFIVLFVLFLLYLFKISKNIDEVDESLGRMPIYKMIIFLIVGLAALVYGSNLTVESAIAIAKIFHVSERIIGLTIVAFGTSLPELATSCIASFKRQNDIAVGNIIGSNIFNILFVLGLTGLIRPIPFEHVFLFDCFVALMAAVGLFFYTYRTKTLTKFQGLSFLLLYVFYLGYLIIK